MYKDFRDIFILDASWVFEATKLGCFVGYDKFLKKHRFSIVISVQQSLEKYFKSLLYKKYNLSEYEDVPYVLNGITHSKFMELRFSHSLDSLYKEVQELIDDDIKVRYDSVRGILSYCYLDLRYPKIGSEESVESAITLPFTKSCLKLLVDLYKKNCDRKELREFTVKVKKNAFAIKETTELKARVAELESKLYESRNSKEVNNISEERLSVF